MKAPTWRAYLSYPKVWMLKSLAEVIPARTKKFLNFTKNNQYVGIRLSRSNPVLFNVWWYNSSTSSHKYFSIYTVVNFENILKMNLKNKSKNIISENLIYFIFDIEYRFLGNNNKFWIIQNKIQSSRNDSKVFFKIQLWRSHQYYSVANSALTGLSGMQKNIFDKKTLLPCLLCNFLILPNKNDVIRILSAEIYNLDFFSVINVAEIIEDIKGWIFFDEYKLNKKIEQNTVHFFRWKYLSSLCLEWDHQIELK